MTDIQRAARFFYLQHNAFGGKTVQQHFGTATTSKAWDASQIEVKLKTAKDRLKGVYIENESWDRCFKRYDREHTFFYADPPYWQTAGYDQSFGWEQYELLAKVMAESKGKVMLSINDHLISGNCLKISVSLNLNWLIRSEEIKLVKPVENWSYVIGKIKSDGSVAFVFISELQFIWHSRYF